MSNDNELQLRIWTLIGQIPAGKVTTYGELAKLAGYPNHARYVGGLLKNLPKDTKLPWHRVINASGQISFPYQSEAYKTQHTKLTVEGVIFKGRKISLITFRWP